MTVKDVRNTGKTQELRQLAELLEPLRAEGQHIVHCHGVFDVLHIGHIRYLQHAKGLGDVLVVTVTPDRYVNKGPHRPAFSQELRAETLASLGCVDYVAINHWPMAVETIHLLRPHFYVKGSDYRDQQQDLTGGIALEEAAVKAVGGQLVFTDEITFSSSNLINRHYAAFSPEVSDYLRSFSAKYSTSEVLAYLEKARELKVLVVGETIIDEYLYCETMGKSGKEPVLAARQIDSERFAGGVAAVANHLAAFCDQVTMVSFLGQQDSQEGFIREKMNPKVEQRFLYRQNGAPTILKRRYVEVYPVQKLFELYVMGDDDGDAIEAAELCDLLRETLPSYDLVVVTDYGHGMLGPDAVQVLADQASFLAVNTQVNAGNLGFNTLSKYKRADYVTVSENEIRLDVRSRRKDLQQIVAEAGARLSCPRILITQGNKGCLCYGQEEGFYQSPALAVRVVDRVGAGDAVFAVTALCAVQGAPMDMVGFIGNAVGAQAVAIVGHRSSIERVPLFRQIESLLK